MFVIEGFLNDWGIIVYLKLSIVFLMLIYCIFNDLCVICYIDWDFVGGGWEKGFWVLRSSCKKEGNVFF